MTKAEFRAQAAIRRAEAARSAPDAAKRLIAHWPESLRPSCLAGFHPIRDEIDPRLLLADLACAGSALCLPVTPPRGSGEPLSFRGWRPGAPLVRSGFGVLEPGPEAPVVTPDVLLVPLLAFDRHGGRLGYGAGHYDRTLTALRARGPVTAIGVAYAAQEHDALPLEPHDAPLDGILTEMGYMRVREDDACA